MSLCIYLLILFSVLLKRGSTKSRMNVKLHFSVCYYNDNKIEIKRNACLSICADVKTLNLVSPLLH